jgi:tryptophan synthase alpha subunit
LEVTGAEARSAQRAARRVLKIRSILSVRLTAGLGFAKPACSESG